MLLLDEPLIGSLVQQPVELFRIREAQLQKPAFAHRIGIDLCRIGGERLVDLRDLPRNRCINFTRRLHRFDDGSLLTLLDPAAAFRKLDINDIPKLRLRIIGDADNSDFLLEP